MEYRWQNAAPDRVNILKGYARKNRYEMTAAEQWLWNHLRDMPGLRFRRQHPIGDYIVDFACLKLNLIIEVDGGYHNTLEQQEKDKIRETDLQEQGYIILRFTNEEVLYDTKTVQQTIEAQIKRCRLLFS